MRSRTMHMGGRTFQDVREGKLALRATSPAFSKLVKDLRCISDVQETRIKGGHNPEECGHAMSGGGA
jgi:hypothetical protein